jgi:C-terminal processing protease CtpA/Prc
MYLRKGNRYKEADHDNMSGLHILREGKDAVVRIVDSGSPGDLAGLKPGDRVLRISDQDARKIDLFGLRNILKSGNGKRIRLTIGRGEKEEDKVVELKEAVPQWDEAAKK